MKQLIISLLMCGAAVAATTLKDGVYGGQATGYAGPVRVEVSVKAGRIADVKVTACRDRFASKVVMEIPRRMVSANSLEVDVVSGATVSSRAIQSAVRKALEEAK